MDRMIHRDYDFVNGKLAKPFSMDDRKSRSDVALFLSVAINPVPTAYRKKYELHTTFVLFAKSGPHHGRFVSIFTDDTRHGCFVKFRQKLNQMRTIGALSISVPKA